jgi:NADH-quinone oxidoreductase subunit I
MSGPYAVDVPVIKVTEQAAAEPSAAWRTLLAFGVTFRHLLRSLFKGDSPIIEYPEKSRQYSDRFRGTHILTVRDDGSMKCVACYMCATACPAECIYIEAGEHPNPEIEKFPIQFNIDMLRCIYCGFCVDACPEEAIIMSREHHLTAGNRNETLFTIENLIERPGIDDKGIGYRPNDALLQSKVYDRAKEVCDFPSTAEQRYESIVHESMINRRE